MFFNKYFLRAGYIELFNKDSEQGLSFGCGIQYNVTRITTFCFDYSFIDFSVFNAIHMFSVSLGIKIYYCTICLHYLFYLLLIQL